MCRCKCRGWRSPAQRIDAGDLYSALAIFRQREAQNASVRGWALASGRGPTLASGIVRELTAGHRIAASRDTASSITSSRLQNANLTR